jgi:hypothetical protein
MTGTQKLVVWLVGIVSTLLVAMAIIGAPSSRADTWTQNCYKEGNSSYACHYQGGVGGDSGYTVHSDSSGSCWRE